MQRFAKIVMTAFCAAVLAGAQDEPPAPAPAQTGGGGGGRGGFGATRAPYPILSLTTG